MYGAKYSSRFADDLEQMFRRGETKNSLKTSAGAMRDELLKKYPGRYGIPSEFEIKQEIQKILAPRKRSAMNALTGKAGEEELPPRAKRARLNPEYVGFLDGLLSDNPSLKPAEGLRMFRPRYPDVADITDSQLFKVKLSSMKRKQ